MSDAIATARAFLAAGNFDAARREAVRALSTPAFSEAAGEARAVLFDCALQQTDYLEAERVLKDWLADDPNGWAANRSRALLAIKLRQREAEQEIDRLRRAFPDRSLEIELLDIARSLELGDGRTALEGCTQLRERGVEGETIETLEARAHLLYDLPQAGRRRTAEAVRARPGDAEARLRHAINAFFAFGILTARREAREARRLDPAQAREANALIVLTWLVWIPNFLVAHALTSAFWFVTRWSWWQVALATVGVILLIPFAAPYANAFERFVGVAHLLRIVFYSTIAWLVILSLTGRLLRRPPRPAQVDLRKDY